jgi:putative spermidine/putrescine transport system ATP-binding protein
VSEPATGPQGGVELIGLCKSYGSLPILHDLSARIAEGTLVSLLGPSGSGKTTVLRIIGGFVAADAGRVILAGRDVTDLPANQRNIGMVFQTYGLFPHMTVRQNVAYGLRMRRVPAAERADRVRDVLEMVRLGGLEQRYPGQLSGGQQQRVAIARAVVVRPALLLLDEPLSNLDAKLRAEMRQEIRRLQQETRLTTLFVTHDQDEALAISDEVIVMNGGRIEQTGTPAQIYQSPETLFVAHFVGLSNLFEGRLDDDGAFVTAAGWRFPVAIEGAVRGPARIGLRPEAIRISGAAAPAPATGNHVTASIAAIAYHGAFTLFTCTLATGEQISVLHPNREVGGQQPQHRIGDSVRLTWPVAAAKRVR